jgi:transketolase
MVGVKDSFGTSGKAEELLKYFNLEPGDIVNAGLRAIERKKSL